MGVVSAVAGVAGLVVFGPLGAGAGVRAEQLLGDAAQCVRDYTLGAPYIASVGLKALMQGKSFKRAWTEEFRTPETQALLDGFEDDLAQFRKVNLHLVR